MTTAVDLFCGAGGTTTGLLSAAAELGRNVELLAINHWAIAIETHLQNHPRVRHLCESLDNVDPYKAVPGKLNILGASPACTHHSNARGGKPRSDQSRASAWHVVRWAEAKQPEHILVENVREFRDWGPLTKKGRPMKRYKGRTFQAFLGAIASLGYEVEYRLVNCADYGDPTTRTRLIILARRGGRPVWPLPSHGDRAPAPWRAAREIIDWTIEGKSIFERKRPLSGNTMKRIVAGLKKFGGEKFIVQFDQTGGGNYIRRIEQPVGTIVTKQNMALVEPFVIGQQSCAAPRSVDEPLPTVATSGAIALVEPFLVKYYGTGESRPLTEPLDTVTTRDRFGLVRQNGFDIRFRMLQPHELAAAMSFPSSYKFAGNREDQVRQIGNAVPVRTAAALFREMLR